MSNFVISDEEQSLFASDAIRAEIRVKAAHAFPDEANIEITAQDGTVLDSVNGIDFVPEEGSETVPDTVPPPDPFETIERLNAKLEEQSLAIATNAALRKQNGILRIALNRAGVNVSELLKGEF